MQDIIGNIIKVDTNVFNTPALLYSISDIFLYL